MLPPCARQSPSTLTGSGHRFAPEPFRWVSLGRLLQLAGEVEDEHLARTMSESSWVWSTLPAAPARGGASTLASALS